MKHPQILILKIEFQLLNMKPCTILSSLLFPPFPHLPSPNPPKPYLHSSTKKNANIYSGIYIFTSRQSLMTQKDSLLWKIFGRLLKQKKLTLHFQSSTRKKKIINLYSYLGYMNHKTCFNMLHVINSFLKQFSCL